MNLQQALHKIRRSPKVPMILGTIIAMTGAWSLDAHAKKKRKKIPAPVHRVQTHDKAYDKHPEWGERINIKVTPPERRGKKGRVLVEVYNFTNQHVQMVDFDLILIDEFRRYRMEPHINAEDLRAKGGGARRWVPIEGVDRIPKIVKVRTRNMKILGKDGQVLRVKHDTDLIKK